MSITQLKKSIINKISFKFDNQIKTNFYTTDYFLKTKKVLLNHKDNKITTMQFIAFSDIPFMMCGAQEIKQLLEFYLTPEQLKNTQMWSLEDGTIVNDNKTPLIVIKGHYTDFMCLENIIDGILSRRCSVATNCMNAIDSLLPHQNIIYMLDRNCDYFVQPYDGYAAYVGGIKYFVTQAQVKFFEQDPNIKVVGTIPHALIQQYENNLPEMIKDYVTINKTNQIYCLLDYENFALKTLDDLKNSFKMLKGVRLDTSSNLSDQSLNDKTKKGVNVDLIKLVKEWLVNHNLSDKEIVVTSKVNPSFIKNINSQVPYVNYYGIGSYFLTPSVHVSADLVEINGKPQAKYGRELLKNFNKLTKTIWK